MIANCCHSKSFQEFIVVHVPRASKTSNVTISLHQAMVVSIDTRSILITHLLAFPSLLCQKMKVL